MQYCVRRKPEYLDSEAFRTSRDKTENCWQDVPACTQTHVLRLTDWRGKPNLRVPFRPLRHTRKRQETVQLHKEPAGLQSECGSCTATAKAKTQDSARPKLPADPGFMPQMRMNMKRPVRSVKGCV